MPSSKEGQVNQVNNTYTTASDWNPVIVLFKKTFCMGKITEMLDAVDVRKENTEELYKIFRLVPDYDIPLMRFSLDKRVSLIRQRINLRGEEFCLVSDLGYPPASFVTQYPTRRMFYFFRVLYRICNPILLSIRIFNPPTLTLLQVFYCDADCKSLY